MAAVQGAAPKALMRRLRGDLRDRGIGPLQAAELAARGLAGDDDPRLDAALIAELRACAAAGGDNGGDDGSLPGLLYQEFLEPEARSGLGQYLTPLPVADLIADVVVGRLQATPRVLDPFCGAGILLDRVAERRPDAELAGIEINEGAAAMCRAAAVLSGHVVDVTLADAFGLWARGEIPQADAVVTNPPFGSAATAAASVKDRLPVPLRSMKRVPAELLGMEVAVDAARDGGLVAAVLPASVITNKSWSAWRRHLFSRLELTGAVSLPDATFAPYRGVSRACVVFGCKTASGAGSAAVPFFRSMSVGYDPSGNPSAIPSDLPAAADRMRSRPPAGECIACGEDGEVRYTDTAARPDEDGAWTLGDIADVFTGRNPGPSDYAASGPFVLKVGNLRGGFIDWADRKKSHITGAVYDKHPKYHLQPGDVCLTAAAHRHRYIGLKADLVCELPETGAVPSAEVMVIRLRDGAPLRPEELLFHLRSETGYQSIQAMIRGSTAHLYASDMAHLKVPASAAGKDEAVALFVVASRLHRRAVLAEKRALRAAGLSV